MFWYLANITAIIIAWILPARSTLKRSAETIRTRRTTFVAALNWILLSGLRAHTVGADTENYYAHFMTAQHTPWSSILNSFRMKYIDGYGGKDVGFGIVEKLFSTIFPNFTLWLLFIAIVFTIPMAKLINRYSRNACISWIVYSTLFYSFFSLTGIRQTLATAIALWGGVEAIRTRRPVRFFIPLLLAYTIHASVVCLIPFYFIARIKPNRIILPIYFAAAVLAIIFRNQLLVVLQNLVGYESYQQYEGAGFGMFAILLYTMSLSMLIFWTPFSKSDNPIFHISVHALMIASVFSSLLLINQSMMRVVQYFSVFIMFLLPEYENLFTDSGKRIFRFAVCAIMIFLLIRNQPQYSFVFT